MLKRQLFGGVFHCSFMPVLWAEVKQWKQACIDGQEIKIKQDKEVSSQSKVDKQRIRELERELNRKEKALAETAALLVLRKKLNALWENEVGEN